MGIFSDLFGKKEEGSIKPAVPEVSELIKIGDEMESLLDCSHYVAKSEYVGLLPEWQKTVDYFNVLKSSGMLETFCKQNDIPVKSVTDICNRLRLFEKLVDVQNERYVKDQMIVQKDYLDNVLKECDPMEII